ncbi:MAG TPA: hypothetical protein VLT32_21145, partial [Candidatus Sulfomarinibacteraceae bacterium]|nr:hypothetical protein [Candidatus Sulfomarinibacteraceae bacterium]
MTVPRARGFLALTAIQVLVLAGLMAWARTVVQVRGFDEVHGKRELVRRLELTDLAIWTEARYTRHPSQADFFAPFQDGPSSLEHFPAGSVVAAPDL